MYGFYRKTINEYMSIDWEAAKAKATSKHPAQQNTEDIGIGTDGELVNLDLWTYEKRHVIRRRI